MQDAVKPFRYSARRGSYLGIVSAIIFLFVVEGGITELLIELFIPISWLKLTIMVVTIGQYLYILIIVLLPLWTKHRLTDTHLYLHYGLALNVGIPRVAIRSVQAVDKISSRIQAASARYDVKRQRIVACISEHGMVLLTLNQPIILKLSLRKRTTTNILFNVDQRDELLHTLSTAET
jgi:hypothetical protein